jgi:hypothetical protein
MCFIFHLSIVKSHSLWVHISVLLVKFASVLGVKEGVLLIQMMLPMTVPSWTNSFEDLENSMQIRAVNYKCG